MIKTSMKILLDSHLFNHLYDTYYSRTKKITTFFYNIYFFIPFDLTRNTTTLP